MEMDKHQLYAKVYGQGIDYKTILEKYSRKQIVFCTTFAYIYKCKYCIYVFIFFFFYNYLIVYKAICFSLKKIVIIEVGRLTHN